MTVGILAYGSLRIDPGPELKAAVRGEPIAGRTRFNVAFARLSATRGMAPTLTRVESGGFPVSAAVLVLDPGVDTAQTREILVRREQHLPPGTSVSAQQAAVDWIREVNREEFDELFEAEQPARLDQIETFAYVDLPSHERQPFSPKQLARRAIESVRRVGGQLAGAPPLDGITYLQQMIELGMPRELTEPYKDAILERLGATSLAEAHAIVRSQATGISLPESAGEPPVATTTTSATGSDTGSEAGRAASGTATGQATSPAVGPQPSADDNSLRSILIKIAGAVAAGVGIVGFVAVVGGAYYWMRFSTAGLPADEAVADMSHTQLIVVGTRLIIPFVGIALAEVVLFYLIESIVKGELTAGPLSFVADRAAKPLAERRLGFRFRLIGVLLVIIVALAVDFLTARRLTWRSDVLAIVVAVALAGVVALYARSPRTDYLRFVLAFIAASAAFAVFWAASQVTEAPDVRPVVMVDDGKPLAGLYVTSSSDHVYIAEVCAARRNSEVGRSTTGSLVDVPRADISLLLVGDNSGLNEAIGREQSLLESLLKLSKVTQTQINAVTPPSPKTSGGALCTGPSAARLEP